MKKHILHIALYIFIISILAGCEQKEVLYTETETESERQVVNETEIHVVENTNSNITVENYTELIEYIKVGFENNFTTVTTDDLEISFVYNYRSNTMGYCFMDLNNDGIEELLLGDSGVWSSTIYDIFTMENDKLVHVLSGGERDRYYLTNKGTCVLANESSVGAALSYYEYYNYSNSNLELIEAVIYDGWKDEEEPWFYNKESATSDGADSIKEEVAREIIDSYEYEKIEFTPFIE